jgi:hypothetical protein
MPGASWDLNVIEDKKHHISTNKTHLIIVLLASPAARRLSKAAGAVGWGVAAVCLTAAAVPSHERVDANVEMLRLMARDGDRYNGCSDGASAANGGVGGGRKDACGFRPQMQWGEEIWPIRWAAGWFVMVIKKYIAQESEKGGEVIFECCEEKLVVVWIFLIKPVMLRSSSNFLIGHSCKTYWNQTKSLLHFTKVVSGFFSGDHLTLVITLKIQ